MSSRLEDLDLGSAINDADLFYSVQGGIDVRQPASAVKAFIAAAAMMWSVAGAASAPAASYTGTWFSGGTATTTKPQVLIEPAGATSTGWSTSGTGLGVNAVSGFTGHLWNAQLNGAVKGYLDYLGTLWTQGGYVRLSGANAVMDVGAVNALDLTLAANGALAFSNTTNNAIATRDVFLLRDGAANTLAMRNGTNAQTLWCYNTWTDASNYERGGFWWDSNVLKMGTFKAGTGTTRVFSIYAGGVRQITSDGSFVQFDVETWVRKTVFAIDNTYDLGDATHRAKDAYIAGNIVNSGGYLSMVEMTAPSAPAANGCRIYAEDDGAGKTRLMALFSSGAAQQIAIQP